MEGMMWSSRAVSFFNQGTAGLHFTTPTQSRGPSKLISAVANGCRSWLSADWSTAGSPKVKPPVWNDINNHLWTTNQSIPFNTIHFLVGCSQRSGVNIQKRQLSRWVWERETQPADYLFIHVSAINKPGSGKGVSVWSFKKHLALPSYLLINPFIYWMYYWDYYYSEMTLCLFAQQKGDFADYVQHCCGAGNGKRD